MLSDGQSHKIQTITGLEQLTGLTRLFLYDSGVTSLPNLNQLTSIQSMYLALNYLGGSNLRWNGLTNLTMGHAFADDLSAQEVDQLFIDLDNNGVSNGEFNLDKNAGPSAASATARANLVSRGNILTYNPLLSTIGYVPAVSATGINLQVAGGTGFTVTAPGATDIKVDIQDLGVQHISSGNQANYYLGNSSQIRNITIEVTPPSTLTALTFRGSGRDYFTPYGNIYSISGLDRFPNLQHLAFYPANLLNQISVPNGVGPNLTHLELLPEPGITSPLSGVDADALIAALVAAGASNGILYIPNRTSASDANGAILSARGWSGVAKVTPTITTLPTATGITYGQSLSASTLANGVGSVAGTFAFTTPATMPNAGTYSAAITFTPADTTYYSTASGNVNVAVAKSTPVITWKNPDNISNMTPLTIIQLNANSGSVAGNFDFSPPEGTILAAGLGQTLSVTFTPADLIDYITATKTVTINVLDVNPSQAVRVDPGTTFYATIDSAYHDAGDGADINACGLAFEGDLQFDLGNTVTLSGGYNGDFSHIIGITSVIGTLIIESGDVTISNIVIK
jgi:hypothetical protein